MLWFIAFIVGLLGGAGVAFGILSDRIAKARSAARAGQDALAQAVQIREQNKKEHAQKLLELHHEIQARTSAVAGREAEAETIRQRLDARVIHYDELVQENAMLKRDLQNVDVTLNKSRMDHVLIAEQQRALADRSAFVAKQYLADTVKSVAYALTVNNYTAMKDRLTAVIERVRSIGFTVTAAEADGYVAQLREEFERLVRIAAQREEQARIKAQIREEERVQREADKAIEQAARERELVENALAKALAEAKGEHNAEVEQLKAQLADAEAKSQRAISMAQRTKAGNVYVISNPGSFGDDVFKVGMTRRLEPMDRVHELGDASVPFPFDVHMMIACDDAPSLENALHRALHRSRLNKVNPRKEFFRSSIQAIADIVKKHRGCEVAYVATAEALEYRESLTMKDDDAAYIESVFDEAEHETAGGVES